MQAEKLLVIDRARALGPVTFLHGRAAYVCRDVLAIFLDLQKRVMCDQGIYAVADDHRVEVLEQLRDALRLALRMQVRGASANRKIEAV